MDKYCVLIIVCFTFSLVSGTKNRTCDYAFGDSSWDYSKAFYDKNVKFPAGTTKQTITLPNEKRLMISYVCVNFPVNINKKTTKMNFDPLEAALSLVLEKEATKDFSYHVLALGHGY